MGAMPDTMQWFGPDGRRLPPARQWRGAQVAARTVMLVEDDPDILNMLTLVFDLAGYTVTRCATSAAALRALASGAPPACVVLDLRLPTLDGATLAHLFQRNPRWARIPVVLMSAYPHGPVMARTLDVPYFAKPFDVDDLVSEVGRLCGH